MTEPLNAYDLWLAEQQRISTQRVAAVREEGLRIIATSRPSIRPMLRKTLDECQADYDFVGSHQSYEWGN